MDRLLNKIAIITGAAKGLGEADARAFIREGAKVVLVDVDAELGIELARELGADASFVRLDVRDEIGWKRLVDEVVAQHGGLDILVNNAGVVSFNTPESITAADLSWVMDVNFEGTVFGCKYAIPAMRRRGGGSIINMSSVAANQGEGMACAYCASKGAIESYTRAVAVYCAQLRTAIRSNAVNPAIIDTPLVRSIPAKMQATPTESPVSEYPLQRVFSNEKGRPEDVASMVVYLASDEARFISGQHFIIDNTASITMGAVP
jgi:3(or 17)beta-hydroxysteroid dehydrogenase